MARFLLLCIFQLCTNGHPQNPYPISPERIYFQDNRPIGNRRTHVEVAPSMEIITPSKGILPPAAPLEEPVKNTQESEQLLAIRLDDAAVALTNFSLNMMKQINTRKSGNIVASPYSVATLLSLLQQGSTGMGLEQISNALQMNQQKSAAFFKRNIADIKSRHSHNTLRSANNIFLANGFSINPGYKAMAVAAYKIDVTPTSFASSAQVANDINNWIAMQTDNQIRDLIAPDALSIETQMLLVNAMSFKGFWDVPFRKQSTKPGLFKLTGGGTKTVQYMKTRRYFKTIKDQYTDSRVIILPFERNEYSLMIIMPSTLITIHDMLPTLTVTQLEKYLNSNPMDVHLEIPKFSIRADTDLTTVLKSMGVSQIFEQRSDLTNIGTYRSINPQVSDAVHSAVLSIDEEGGSAAAASAFAVVALSNDEPSTNFIVNRPFVAVLWDGKAKLPLFIAAIEDPTL